MVPFKTTSLNVSTAATIGSGLTISGNISGNNLRVSFNQGSATGNYSFAEGDNTLAFGTASHAEGIETIASGDFSHAEGIGSFAVSNYSHAEGSSTKTGEAVNFETFYTNGVNICIFTFSPSVTSKFNNVTAGTKLVGYNDISSILAAFTVIGRSTITGNITGDNTFGFGEPTSHGSEGYVISRTGTESHAEGNQTTASGFASHAEGQLARALGGVSHAEGNETTASGYTSHAEGDNTLASGDYSHAGGQITIARGNVSHASGRYVEAAHARTWIWKGSTTNSFLSTTRADQFMVSADGGTAFFGNVGIGTDNNSNALTVVGTISASQHGNSSQWNSTYTTVCANSASWGAGGGGISLATVTNYLSTNNVLLSSATVSDTLSISSLQIRSRGSSNVFIGDSTTGNNSLAIATNTFVFGMSAGFLAAQDACDSVFMGKGAGMNTVFPNNIFIGYYAGNNNRYGQVNIFMGRHTGRFNIDGSFNNFIGSFAGCSNTYGSGNNFFGRSAGLGNTTGNNNNFIGFRAGQNNTTGGSNFALGCCAGFNNTTGISNVFLGSNAGSFNQSGSNNIFMGNNANTASAQASALNGIIAIGTNATATQTNQIVLSTANISIRSLSGTTAGPNLFIGNSTTGRDAATGNHNFVFGLSAGNALTSGGNNVFVGGCAGRLNSSGSSNNFFGALAGFCNTTGNNNNFIGSRAGRYNTTGSCNNFIGNSAGYLVTTGGNNSFFGSNAGRFGTLGVCFVGSRNSVFGACAASPFVFSTTISACNNSFFGFKAGAETTNGNNNNFFGYNAGCSNTTGNYNNFIGDFVGRNNTTGNSNNFFGNQAGCCNTTGNSNLFLGNCAGGFNRVGSDNIFIGNNANTASAQVSALNNVIVLGTGATATQTNQIVLSTADISIRSLSGTTAGPNLFIGNSTTGNNDATGNHNFVFGLNAGNALTSGGNNVFVGRCAGRLNSSGSSNNFFGDSAGRLNSSGSSNNFFGYNAGRYNSTGSNNNFFGCNAGRYNSTGSFNNFIGRCAGTSNTAGSNNTIIGNNANVSTSNLSGVIVLGTGAIATQSHQIVFSTANVLFRSTGNTFEVGSPSLTDNLTVFGTISGTQAIFASEGNSNQWNSSFTTTQANTATDSFDLSYVGTLPAPLIPIHTTTPLRDALLGASGSQAATLRNGKWITGLSITGYNNPTIDNLISLSSTNIVGIRDSFSLSNLTRLSAVSFPSLASIGGAFTGNSSGGTMNSLTTMSFPSLASIGGNFTGNSGSTMNSLTTMSFPSLASIGGAFTGNSSGTMNSLTTMSFPSLASIGGSFTGNVGTMNSLTTMSFPSLASIGGNFTGNMGTMNSLTTMSFPSLASIGGVFTGNGSVMNSLTTMSFPSLASIGGAFTGNSSVVFMNSLTTLLIGSGLKHINGDFSSGNIGLDRHNAWSANTYYPSATSFTAPASAFSSTTTGTTCSAAITNHGLQTGDIITVSGITGTTAATHNFNAVVVPVTRIDANNFSYTITATTQIPTGTATIQRQEVTVTPITKNGRKYICTGAGTSSGTEPTWPTTIGQTVTDGTVTWTCSEMSLPNILSRLDALSGTNQTTTYGANRFISIGPITLPTVNSISTTAGVATITTATNHGITTGTQVVISGCTGTALRYNGVWTVTSTGLTTLTTPVPTDLNGVAGAGTMRLTNSCPQYTGSTPISATTITGVSADSHMIFSTTQLRDADNGTGLPIFVAGIYNLNGTINGFARYSCTENSWDIWYDTTSKRWVNSPSNFAGNTTVVGNYPHTAQSVPLASTSSANPAVITSSVNHGVATGAVFTVVIEGCSNTALNGSWTATSTGTTTFTIPVNGSAGATTDSGTVAVLNQTFNQGRLMSGTVASPIQGVLQTITTTSNHGFSNGDFIHFYGAVGTHAASIIDSNTSSTTKSVTTAITVTNATTFTLVRYANSQPFIGSYTLTTMPHMRDPSVNDVAYHTALKLRARGLAVSLHGANGI